MSAGERTRRTRQRAKDTTATPGASSDASGSASPPALDPAAVAQAQVALATVNLDEWEPTPFRVAFLEWEEVEEPLWEGSTQTIKRRIPHPRYATLTTDVSSEAQLAAMRLVQDSGTAWSSLSTGNFTDEQVTALRRVVLLGWQCFEPEMTLERLARGINLMQTMALVQRFFTPTTPTGQSRATTLASDGASTPASSAVAAAAAS